ncbi:hypothetical protein BJ165DRAFT_170199 [Panaeolus papilionaceus]|nr:hypothetical protein BJ165DRAFT_170199 [Panaeolus papilionaceus]
MAPLQLTSLPYDILLQTFALLQPEGVISVRNTCKVLASISYQKSIWKHIAEQVCEQNFLFCSSQSLEQLASSKLEAISTGPRRWENTMLGGNSSISASRAWRLSTTGLFMSGFPINLFLVPGGQFLLAH